jgi:hypothetical protein
MHRWKCEAQIYRAPEGLFFCPNPGCEDARATRARCRAAWRGVSGRGKGDRCIGRAKARIRPTAAPAACVNGGWLVDPGGSRENVMPCATAPLDP